MGLSSKGIALSCGSSEVNGLGQQSHKFEIIDSLESEFITDVAVADGQSLLLSKKNEIYSFGKGYSGALGHGNKEDQLLPKKIEYFAEKKIKVGAIYANCDQSAAVSVNKDALFVWGRLGDAPERMQLDGDSKGDGSNKILSVGLGYSMIGVVYEKSEEYKESEYVLQSGENKTIEDVENNTAHQVFIKNQKIFGDDDWIQVNEQPPPHSLFPYFGHDFASNLKFEKEENKISLINSSKIDSFHHSDIIGAEFFLVLDGKNQSNVIESEEEKQEFMKISQKYSFGKMEEISFKVPENEAKATIYTQPKGANSIYLLKEVNLFLFDGL